jgi:hypothetical protein
VYASSAGGTTKITLSGGTTNVFVTYPAEIATMLGNPTPTAGGVLYGTGSAAAVTPAGTSGYFLQSTGSGAPTWASVGAAYTKTDFTATAGQTSFSATYTVGYVDVFYNGSKLSTSEYTASTGTTVVLGTACAVNDIVEIIAWTVLGVTNTNIGIGTGTSLALGGATIGTNALAVTGTTALSSTLNFGGYAAEGTVTAAATTDLGTSTANRQSVTGNTTITSFGTGANLYRIIRFTGAPLLTYNATTLITPNKANIQAAPGDIATLTSDGSGNWTIINYLPAGGVLTSTATGLSGTGPSNGASLSLTPGTWLLTAGYLYSGTGGTVSAVIITPTSGSLTGIVYTQNAAFGPIAAATGVGYSVISNYKATITATTTYYAVYNNNGSANSDNVTLTAQRIY